MTAPASAVCTAGRIHQGLAGLGPGGSPPPGRSARCGFSGCVSTVRQALFSLLDLQRFPVAFHLGGGVGLFLTRGDSRAPKKALLPFDAMPTAGVIGQSMTRTGSVPIYGFGLSGTF